MNENTKLELLKLAAQLVMNDKSAGLHLAPGARMGMAATEMVQVTYKSLLATLTDNA